MFNDHVSFMWKPMNQLAANELSGFFMVDLSIVKGLTIFQSYILK